MDVDGYVDFTLDAGSTPAGSIGDIAQLEEHCLCKAGVKGSSPFVSIDIFARVAELADAPVSKSGAD